MPEAQSFLREAAVTMDERARTYDQREGGERSMARTVAAFNAITGRDLTESDGWLLMLLLKQVRQWSAPAYHHDSALDAVAYSALLAESLSREDDELKKADSSCCHDDRVDRDARIMDWLTAGLPSLPPGAASPGMAPLPTPSGAPRHA